MAAPMLGMGNGAADEITPEHIADFVQLAYHRFDPGERDELCDHLQDLVDTHHNSNGTTYLVGD